MLIRKPPEVKDSQKEILYQLADDNLELCLQIIGTIKLIDKNPGLGELALSPNLRYYTDDDQKFRITYVVFPDYILVTVIKLLT
ncbi:MAG: hypothetical protein HQM11_13680 [SAR324 cluster bacterium]|nr:hypothetical protein [SAR324 cluster bacterium]